MKSRKQLCKEMSLALGVGGAVAAKAGWAFWVSGWGFKFWGFEGCPDAKKRGLGFSVCRV